jgi:thiol-disulfide isomerase/thioredoxin
MTTKRQLLWVSLAGLGALTTGAMTAGMITASRQEAEKAAPPTKVDSLWALMLPTPNDTPLLLSQFKGKPLLINFWATWCAPCIEEIPLLNRFYQQNRTKSLQLLGIAVDKHEAINLFLTKAPVQFPIALAGFEGIALSQSLGNTFGSLPFTVLLNTEGAILFVKSGQLTTDDLRNITNLVRPASR